MVIKLPVYGKEGGTPGEAFYRTETGEETVGGGGGGGGRYNYGVLFLSDRGLLTQNSIQYAFNGGDGDRVYQGFKNGEYNLSFIDIVEYDANTQLELFRHELVQITSEADVYLYMQANCANDGTNYNNVIKGFVYDVIDSTIQGVEKVNGMNAFYSALMGTGNYKRSSSPSLVESETNIGNFQDIVQDMIRTMTPFSAYTYNSADQPYRIIRTPRNHRTLYGLINADGIIYNTTPWRTCIDSTNTFVQQTGEYSINHNNSWYYVLNLNTGAFSKYRKNELKYIMYYINNPDYSVILAYQVQEGDRYAVYIKPVGVDNIYIDYVDLSKYEIYGIHHARNQRISLQNIKVMSSDMYGNTSWILKGDRIYKQYTHKSKGGYREQPYTQFILRDLATNKVSSLSNARIQWRGGRDRPIYATVNY